LADTNNSLFFLFSSSSFLGILCFILLVLVNQHQKHANKLLGLGLLSFSFILIFNTLVYIDDFYVQHPYLWRLGLPFQYLAAPFFYLYIRATLYSETKYRKWDWLLFLPAGLHFIEHIPFYLTPTAEKIAHIKYVFLNPKLIQQQNEGFLPSNIHLILKTAIGVVFQILEVKLLIHFYRNNKIWITENLIVWNWLKKLTAMLIIMYVFLLFIFLFHNHVDLGNLKIAPVGIFLFFVTVTLLFYPRVLYGMHGDLVTLIIEDEDDSLIKTIAFSEGQIAHYKEKIENSIVTQKGYLIKGYSIKQFSDDCDVPAHHLSAIINREYDLSFSDFINKYRVNFVIDNKNTEKYNQFSLEGLALEGGFNSRSSFTNAFKKVTGETPSVYFKQKTV
jgi:AraC-like DNA-binding protein